MSIDIKTTIFVGTPVDIIEKTVNIIKYDENTGVPRKAKKTIKTYQIGTFSSEDFYDIEKLCKGCCDVYDDEYEPLIGKIWSHLQPNQFETLDIPEIMSFMEEVREILIKIVGPVHVDLYVISYVG